MTYVTDEFAVKREMQTLMHQEVHIGGRKVGRVIQVEAPRRGDGYPESHLLATIQVEHPFIRRQQMLVPYSTAPLRRQA